MTLEPSLLIKYFLANIALVFFFHTLEVQFHVYFQIIIRKLFLAKFTRNSSCHPGSLSKTDLNKEKTEVEDKFYLNPLQNKWKLVFPAQNFWHFQIIDTMQRNNLINQKNFLQLLIEGGVMVFSTEICPPWWDFVRVGICWQAMMITMMTMMMVLIACIWIFKLEATRLKVLHPWA